MTDYQSLGIRPLINAYATVTKFGGSLMPPEVVSAITAAAAGFVDLADLQRRVGERIAQLTRNEAAYITSGAAAGIQLASGIKEAPPIRQSQQGSGKPPLIDALSANSKRLSDFLGRQTTAPLFQQSSGTNGAAQTHTLLRA